MSSPTSDGLRGSARRIALGLLAGQTLIYGVTPLISRFYEPAFVGRAGTFLALASVIGTISTLRWETQLPRATAKKAPRYVALGTACIVGTGIATAFISFFTMGLSEALMLALTSAGIGFIGLGMQWSARAHDMTGLALSKVSQGVLQAGSQVALGFVGLTRLGLQAGLVLGYAGSAVTQWVMLARRGHAPARPRRPLSATRREWLSVLGLTVATLINLGTVWAQLLIVSIGYSDTDVGHFSMAQRLSIAPAGLIVAALAPPLLARVGQRSRSGASSWPPVRDLTLKLAPFTLLVSAVMIFVPRQLVEIVLGEEWGLVTDYAAALSPLIFGLIVVGPASQVIAILGETRIQLLWDVSRAAAVAGIGAWGLTSGWTAVNVTLGTSLALLAWYVAYLGLVRRVTNRSDQKSEARP